MTTSIMKGFECNLFEGYDGSEASVTLIASTNLNIENNLEAFYAAGDNDVSTVKEGNRLISGSSQKAFVKPNWLCKATGISSTITFAGITSPSSTHTIFEKTATAANTILAPAAWAGSELSNANYTNVSADDASEFSRTSSTASQYPAILIKFDNVIGAGTEADINFVTFEIIGYGTADTNGFDVYAYDFDGADWEKIGESTASAAYGSVIVSLPSPTKYMEVATGDIYIMVRPKAVKGTANSVLHVDYVTLKVSNNTVGLLLDGTTNLKFILADGTTTITLTAEDFKIGSWGFAFAGDGATVFENINWQAKSLTKTQA